MASGFSLNRMDLFALLAVAATSFLFVGSALSAADFYATVRTLHAGDVILGLSGWLIATFGSIMVAVAFWRWAKRVRRAWVLHLLMLPAALATVRLGGTMMLAVTGTPDFDDTFDGPILQGLVLFLLACVGYYSAVVATALARSLAAAAKG